MLKCSKCNKNEGLFEVGYVKGIPILLCYECWNKDTPSIIKDTLNNEWEKLLKEGSKNE